MTRLTRYVALVAGAAAVAAPVRSQQLDTATALSALRDARAACSADAARLWSRSLCGPIALVDRGSRLVIANDTIVGRAYVPYQDAFITTAPGTVYANTSVTWGGRSWATILLPLPADRFDRVALVMHEVLHREQDSLLLAGQDPPNNQLDQLEGRRWFRLELHALASALDALASNSPDLRLHVESALLFRARRRSLYPTSDSLESALEMQEGLAEYTGDRLAMSLTGETASRVARRIRAFETDNETYVRSFAYATGPALGLLLDRFAPTWRGSVRITRDPARLLATAIGFRIPTNLAREAERRAANYGGRDIAIAESARDSVRRGPMADYRARLVDGPTVYFRQSFLSRSFDPRSLIGFDMVSTVYPTGTFGGPWGSLEVTSGGALVANDYRWLRVPAPPGDPAQIETARVIKGDGWTLTLAPGWKLYSLSSKQGSWGVAGPPESR